MTPDTERMSAAAGNRRRPLSCMRRLRERKLEAHRSSTRTGARLFIVD